VNLDSITNVAGAIVTVALVTTIVSHKETANIVKAIGGAFSGSLYAAQGIKTA
jgi:hypothetical protein